MVYLGTEALLVSLAAGLAIIEQYRSGTLSANSTMPYIGALFDSAGILAFASVLTHFALQYSLNWKQRSLMTLLLTVVYLSSYSLLTCCGKYHASRSGENRWKGIGLAVVDQELWHAKGIFWQPFVTVDGKHTFQGSLLGYFYSPLINFDRILVHKTVKLFDPP